jgi:hypothetical protein
MGLAKTQVGAMAATAEALRTVVSEAVVPT